MCVQVLHDQEAGTTTIQLTASAGETLFDRALTSYKKSLAAILNFSCSERNPTKRMNDGQEEK